MATRWITITRVGKASRTRARKRRDLHDSKGRAQIVVCLACLARLQRADMLIMGYQLYIQILAQYNPEVLHVCDREETCA
jgi:hypothetical protein